MQPEHQPAVLPTAEQVLLRKHSLLSELLLRTAYAVAGGRSSAWLWAVALGGAALVFAVGGRRLAAQGAPPTFKAASTVVELVLRATDESGRPVTDLRRSQIEVLDNGRPGRIVSFAPAWERPAAATRAAAVGARQVHASPTRAPNSAAGPPRYLGFVIDLTASHYAIRQARLAIAKFVRSGRARGRPLALFAVGEQGLMLIPFTADHRAFANRLMHVTLRWSPWQEGEVLRELINGLRDCARASGATSGVTGALIFARSHNQCGRDLAHQYTNEVLWHTNDVLSSLVAVVRYLGSLPGPKTLVYLGPGFMFSPGRVATLAYESDLGPANDLLLELAPEKPHLWELADAALHADVTLDGVDPRGLITNINSLPGRVRVKLWGPMGPRVATEFWTEVNEGDHDGMAAAVAPTGGEAIFRSNDVAGELAAAAGSDEGVYYVSYVPADQRRDGRFHKIKVLARRGVRIRTRAGYYALRRKRLAATFWAGEPGKQGAAPVCVRIPNRALHWQGGGRRRTDLLSVWSRIADASGAIIGSDLWAPYVIPGKNGYVRLTLRPRLPAGGSIVVHVSEVATGRAAELDAPAARFLNRSAVPMAPAGGSCPPPPAAGGG
jgi:VWFA-related protein